MKRLLYIGLFVVVLAASYFWLSSRQTIQPSVEQASGWKRLTDATVYSSSDSKLPPQSSTPKAEHTQPTTLNAGGLTMGLAFENGGSDPVLEQLVLTDLNLILGHLGSSEFLPPNE